MPMNAFQLHRISQSTKFEAQKLRKFSVRIYHSALAALFISFPLYLILSLSFPDFPAYQADYITTPAAFTFTSTTTTTTTTETEGIKSCRALFSQSRIV